MPQGDSQTATDQPKKKLVKVKDVGVIAFPGHFDDDKIIEAIRAHKTQPALDPRLADVAKTFPALTPYLSNVQIQQGTKAPGDDRGLEFYPPWESQNPNPGKITLQLFDKMQGPELTSALGGDLLHYLGSLNPKNGAPIDPKYYAMKLEVLKARTPQQDALDRKIYADSVKNQGEKRSYPQWLQQSRIDAYIRGYVTPELGGKYPDEWRKQGQYKNQDMLKAVQDIQKYVTGGNKQADDRLKKVLSPYPMRTAPPSGPLTTEQSEHARQLKPAQPLSSVIEPIDKAFAPSGPPTSNLEAAVYAPKESAKGAAAMTIAPFLHPLDTAKSLWEQARQFMPAYANTAEGFPVPVPNSDTFRAAMQVEDQFKQHPEYIVGSFVLPAAIAHGLSAKPLAEKPPRVNTSVIAANDLGEVRVGSDKVPSVWLSPKGWDAWMHAYQPAEDPRMINGMSVRADTALKGMFNSKVGASPEWSKVQELLGKAHDAANGRQAVTMVAHGPEAAIHVLPEEAVHSWQRTLSQKGELGTHLPADVVKDLHSQIPEGTKKLLADTGYDPKNERMNMLEASAKYITGDNYGATPEEAARFLDKYFSEVTKAHGPDALNKLDETWKAIAETRDEINADHQRAQAGGRAASLQPMEDRRGQGAGPVATPQTAEDAAFQRGQQLRFPNLDIRQGSQEFTDKRGRRISPPMFAAQDPRAMQISDAYAAMKHEPNEPKVKASYDALKNDIKDQWELAKKIGITAEPWNREGQPYRTSYDMMKDLHDNKHLYFFKGGDMPADHPLSEVEPETGLTYNDMLRVVHDIFGHAKEGFQFGGRGEENAWLAHSQMFSPEALPALTTETKGQNSWVNYGPHMRDTQGKLIHPGQSGFLNAPERPYAEQKAGILPERFLYRNDTPLSFMSPNLFHLDMAKAGSRLASPTHKLFTGVSNDLTRALGLNANVSDAIGHWEGGAEDSVIHHFPMGTDKDTVLYHGAIMGKTARQNYYGAFFPDTEGPDRLYAFWVDGSKYDAEKIARVLEQNGISGSTIEPAEGGFSVFTVGEGEKLLPKVDAVTTDLGVNSVEQYNGNREFIGDKNRDKAERNYTSKIEELESKHPEWRKIREGIESRPDYRTLHDYIRRAEKVAGTPLEGQIVDDNLFRREPVRTWDEISPHLSEDEKAKYDDPDKRAKLVGAVNDMPSPEEWDAAVKAGSSGKLWYERSSRAFDALVESQPDMFRKTDKKKFLNFIAALSPVQPVRQNLLMAINLWDKWNKAGRPVDVIWKDSKNLTGIASKNSSLYRILKGGRNTYGVDLPARLNNAIRALQDQPMSGPKVSAFAPNLGSDAQRSTNDTWMAIFGNADPNKISQPHLYDAMSSMVREAGEKNGIPPRQAQAAIWSFIKSLAELSGWGKDRWIPPQEIVKQGLLTPELINQHAADFADMLANDPEIRDRIKAIGGDLDELDKKLGKYVPTRPEQATTEKVDPRLLNAAKRLEAARTDARIQSHLAAKSDNARLFDTSFGGDDLAFQRQPQDLASLKAEAEKRDQRPWYLKSERLIDQKMKGPMPANDVRRMLTNNGVTADEMKWTGLDDLLKSGEKVTPDEVKAHLAQNSIQIQEVTKGMPPDNTKWEVNALHTKRRELIDRYDELKQEGEETGDQSKFEEMRKIAHQRAMVEAEIAAKNEKFGPTKYERYVEPGGHNYRELLLTLPEKNRPETNITRAFADDFGGNFTTTHWDEPNVLAHVRMNDRTGPRGEKLLHVEELQSDWHQKGRKYRYADPNKPFAVMGIEGQFVTREEAEVAAKAANVPTSFIRDERVDELPAGVIPDAPFKKDWHEMAIRRVMQYAAENNYDGVSWTGGEKQAARYDLSKHLDSIRYAKPKLPGGSGYDGKYEIFGSQNGSDVLHNWATEKELPDYVGKDIAEKIIAGHGDDSGSYKKLSGLDLKVGGEGMKGFYDKIVPDYMNKFGKKWGAKVQDTKVSVGELVANNVFEYDGPEHTREDLSDLYKDIKDGKRADVSLAEGTNFVNRSRLSETIIQIAAEMGRGRSYSDAVSSVLANNKPLIENFSKELGGKARQKTHRFAKSQYLPVTDSMRDSLSKEGVPLFQRERRVNPTLRKRITEMSSEEMRHLLLHSDVVDLPNRRSFDEAERDNPAPAVARSDADALKAFNDVYGYESGNALLKAKADALKQAGLEAYHEKGDEFLYRGDSPQDLKDRLEKARNILRNTTFDVTMDDGTEVQLRGVDFSYGVGHDIEEAEHAQHAHKSEREARGERKRGELAGISQTRKDEENQIDQGSQTPAALREEAQQRFGAIQSNGEPDTPTAPEEPNDDILEKLKAEAIKRVPVAVLGATSSLRQLRDEAKARSALVK